MGTIGYSQSYAQTSSQMGIVDRRGRTGPIGIRVGGGGGQGLERLRHLLESGVRGASFAGGVTTLELLASQRASARPGM
ncbi:MAG: hypothetical protein HC824_20270 [Synechococcales cyanobacterium RM1_1_8]|nr:hypothetical protein [Synechococcales cyanobacterium RM1_1_8]